VIVSALMPRFQGGEKFQAQDPFNEPAEPEPTGAILILPVYGTLVKRADGRGKRVALIRLTKRAGTLKMGSNSRRFSRVRRRTTVRPMNRCLTVRERTCRERLTAFMAL
jgi:hypothetical protein